MPSKAPGTQKKNQQSTASSGPHHGAIRIAAVAAAAEAIKAKAQQAAKPEPSLPPCMKDIDRQTD